MSEIDKTTGEVVEDEGFFNEAYIRAAVEDFDHQLRTCGPGLNTVVDRDGSVAYTYTGKCKYDGEAKLHDSRFSFVKERVQVGGLRVVNENQGQLFGGGE